MKSLNSLKNQFGQVLSREELKNVVGGGNKWCMCNNDPKCQILTPESSNCTEICKRWDSDCNHIDVEPDIEP